MKFRRWMGILAILASGSVRLFADGATTTVALEPTNKIIYPNASDVIPGKIPATPPAKAQTAEAAPSPSLSSKALNTPKSSPAPATASASAPVSNSTATTNSAVNLTSGWYLRWGPWSSQELATKAFSSIYQSYPATIFATATWAMQALPDGSWSLLAGPFDESLAVQALKSGNNPPAGLYHP